ncbi:hypothetical protein [Roseomonas sp. BN140053]|uniref:hypothetical protein n=1 Tax=Roseomonas sp. BN140053 TaxID=3391898 RepID=UPI0039ECF018
MSRSTWGFSTVAVRLAAAALLPGLSGAAGAAAAPVSVLLRPTVAPAAAFPGTAVPPGFGPPPFAQPVRLSPAELQALRRWLCPNGGAPVRGAPGRCDGRPRRGVPGGLGSGGGGGGDAEGWFSDLPPARGGQIPCPEGTRRALARGHSDVVRCLPG